MDEVAVLGGFCQDLWEHAHVHKYPRLQPPHRKGTSTWNSMGARAAEVELCRMKSLYGREALWLQWAKLQLRPWVQRVQAPSLGNFHVVLSLWVH
ncbi:hypothetical protein AAY473_010160 [Plecturocebus cupreus]